MAFLESYVTNLEFEKCLVILEFEKCLVIFCTEFLNFSHSAPFGFTKKKSFFFLAYTFASMAKGRCYRGRNHWLGCILLISLIQKNKKKLSNYIGFKKNVDVDFYLQLLFTPNFLKKELKIYLRKLKNSPTIYRNCLRIQYNFLTFEKK